MMDFPVAKITYKRFNSIENPVFSILIPTWNNLNCLKFCVESIRRNSHFAHQIILHINQGNDGTIEWAEENEISYSRSAQNAGVCYGFNAPATLAQSDYLVLLNDDKYLCPAWDFYLWQEIEKIGHPYFALSSTMIEHTHTKNNCAMAPHDFGSTPETFNEQALLAVFDKITFHDWNGSKWYPMVIHRKIWELVGGLSIEFSPGMYSDPDFMMKLWQAGVRYFKGVSKSRAYHLMSKSVSRIKKNNGRKQFLLKWGITSSTFSKYYLRMGEPFSGNTGEPAPTPGLKRKLLLNKIKHLLQS